MRSTNGYYYIVFNIALGFCGPLLLLIDIVLIETRNNHNHEQMKRK